MKAIQIENLTKIYPPDFFSREAPVTALRGVTLEVEKGTIYTLLGPNGSGKTTFLHILSGLLPPTRGEAWVAGVPVRDQRNLVKKIGFLDTGESGLVPFLKGIENLELFSTLYDLEPPFAQKKIRELVQLFDLNPYLSRKAKTYSRGVKQRFLLVRALLHEPEVILLDEPVVHLDPIGTRDFHALLRDILVQELGKTVFLTTHQLEEALEISDRLGFLFQGELVWERPCEFFESRPGELLRMYLETAGAPSEEKSYVDS